MHGLGTKIGPCLRDISAWARGSKNVKAVVSLAELLGKLTIVIGVLSYISEAPERARQRHYQAWQLINGARKSPGEAGRSIAIGVLVADHEKMTDLDLSGGNFAGKDFRTGRLPGVNFTNAKLDGTKFSCKAGLFMSDHWLPSYSSCWITDLERARFATISISEVHFEDANLKDAILGGSSTGLTVIENSSFSRADMQNITVQDARLRNNTFSYAQMQNSKWLGGAILSQNQFVGANLKGARWYGVDFRDSLAIDFTDADLSEVRVSDQVVPFQDEVLSDDNVRLQKARLCRTRFSDRIVNRDCR